MRVTKTIEAKAIDWCWWTAYHTVKLLLEGEAATDDAVLAKQIQALAIVLLYSPEQSGRLIDFAMKEAGAYISAGAVPLTEIAQLGEVPTGDQRAPAIAALVPPELFEELADGDFPVADSAREIIRWTMWSLAVDLWWDESLLPHATLRERLNAFLQLQHDDPVKLHVMVTFGMVFAKARLRDRISQGAVEKMAEDFGLDGDVETE